MSDTFKVCVDCSFCRCLKRKYGKNEQFWAGKRRGVAIFSRKKSCPLRMIDGQIPVVGEIFGNHPRSQPFLVRIGHRSDANFTGNPPPGGELFGCRCFQDRGCMQRRLWDDKIWSPGILTRLTSDACRKKLE
jgi:hypothetical protein